MILVSHRSRKILVYLTACLLFSCICWSKERYSLPLQTLAQSCPEAVMAAGALSIRLDISFCPAGKLAGSSCASPKTLTKCSSNSCHNSLNASCFPAAALQIPGGMCVPRLSVVSTISVMLRGVCSPELGTDRQTPTGRLSCRPVY